MKVIMFKYRSINLYSMVNKALFWLEEDSEYADKITNLLLFGTTKTPDSVINADVLAFYNKKRTRLAKVIESINQYIADHRQIVHIDEHDAWNLDDSLSPIIYGGVKKLKEIQTGSMRVEDDDVPLELRSHCSFDKEDGKSSIAKHDYVLNEILFAFNPSTDIDEVSDDDMERSNNGRRLFAKYYHSLWD